MDDRHWTADALCARVDPELWYPKRGEDFTKRAKRICAECPVRVECLNDAGPADSGIWGGVSERARRKLRETGHRDPLPDNV